MVTAELKSPNDWITKAGGSVSPEGDCVLPITDVLLPMHNASTSFVAYETEKDEHQYMERVGRMSHIQNIALNVRAADKAYFGLWSRSLIDNNIHNPESVSLFGNCKNCLQLSLSPNSIREHISRRLKELSDLNNQKIIHAMDSGLIIQPQDFEIALKYYNEFLNLDLTCFPELKGLKKRVCSQCAS